MSAVPSAIGPAPGPREPPKAAATPPGTRDLRGDLDGRIRATELRLIDREERLRRGLRLFGGRVRQASSPRRLVVPVLGGVLGLVALVWLLRAPRGRAAPTARSAAGAPRAGGRAALFGFSEGTWIRFVGLAWPLLPARWRARISPATAATAAAVGLPLLEKLLARPEPIEAPATMAHVDLARFAGTWHEIARLPAPFEAFCDGQPNATYRLQGGRIEVINRCRHGDGREIVGRGEARIVPGSGNAQWQVSLWPAWLRALPMAWADAWILFVDDDYQLALLGHPSRSALWLLSRRRLVTTAEQALLVERAAAQGYPVHRLRFVQGR